MVGVFSLCKPSMGIKVDAEKDSFPVSKLSGIERHSLFSINLHKFPHRAIKTSPRHTV